MPYSALMTVLCSRITYILLMVLGLAIGGYCAYLDHLDQTIRTRYQQTKCTIKDAEVTMEEEVHHARGRGHYITRTYYPEITYVYTVNGVEHEGYEYRAFEGGMAEAEATAVVSRYDPGQTATCYYDPENLDDAVLTLDCDRRGIYTAAAWGLLLLAVGLGGWIVIDFVLPSLDKAARKPNVPEFKVEIPEWSSIPRTS